jgi:hypothetical protein
MTKFLLQLLLVGLLFDTCSFGPVSYAQEIDSAEESAGENLLSEEQLRAAVAKSLPLLEKGVAGHLEHRTCFACHSQAVPMFAVKIAQTRGFTVDEALIARSIQRTRDVLERWAKNNPDRKTFGGGQADTAVYALLLLAIAEQKPDETTAAVVEYLLLRDNDRGHWRATHDNRLPTEGSSFNTTALAIRGLQTFAAQEQQERVQTRIAAAREWMLKTEPRDTEDRVFRLWGLKSAGASPEPIDSAVKELLQTQRADGGWSQTSEMESDPYATGTALVALHMAGGLKTEDAAYQRGLRYLLANHKDDGSWHVTSRSANRFQAYFESGFPYEKDQWISHAASGWSAAALALACKPSP